MHRLAADLVVAGVDAMTLHPRFRNDGFYGAARWEEIRRLSRESAVPVIGNGDVRRAADVFRMTEETGCRGVMIGRAGLAQPWIFSQAAAIRRGERPAEPGPGVRCRLILEHFHRLVASEGEHRALHRIRGYTAWYTRGLTGGAGLRRAVNGTASAAELAETITAFFESYHAQ